MSKNLKHFSPKVKTEGFTLIELLVVIAIIALLSSVALIALMSARQKGRDVKRLADMTQMATAMELYFSTYKGYPSTTGSPTPLIPGFTLTLPSSPQPADGGCELVTYPVGSGTGSNYYYYPSPTGGAYLSNGETVYPDYAYFFCLGNKTGNFGPGMHQVTPKIIR